MKGPKPIVGPYDNVLCGHCGLDVREVNQEVVFASTGEVICYPNCGGRQPITGRGRETMPYEALQKHARALHKERDAARRERDEVRRERETQEGRADFWKTENRRIEDVLNKAGVNWTGCTDSGVANLVRERDEALVSLRQEQKARMEMQAECDTFKAQRDSFAQKAAQGDDQVDQLTRERNDFKMKWDNTVEGLTKAYKDLEALQKTAKPCPVDKLPDDVLSRLHYDLAKELLARGIRRLPYERGWQLTPSKKDDLLERLEKIVSHSVPNSIAETASETAEIAEILTAVLRDGKL